MAREYAGATVVGRLLRDGARLCLGENSPGGRLDRDSWDRAGSHRLRVRNEVKRSGGQVLGVAVVMLCPVSVAIPSFNFPG